MDGLWFLIAIALLRFVWRFVERAARKSGEESSPPTAAEGEGRRRRRRGALPQPQTGRAEREPAPVAVPPWARGRERGPHRRQRQTASAPGRRAESPSTQSAPPDYSDPDTFLERLRQAVEAASGAGSQQRAPQRAPQRAERQRRESPPTLQPPSREPLVATPMEPSPKRAPTQDDTDERHGGRREPARARELRRMLRHRATVRDALLLREILGPPVARRGSRSPLRAG